MRRVEFLTGSITNKGNTEGYTRTIKEQQQTSVIKLLFTGELCVVVVKSQDERQQEDCYKHT